MIKKHYYLALLLISLSFVTYAADDKKAISETLNKFHQAAANANATSYLNLLTDDAIFLGTDASERWTKKQFSAFVLPYFEQGKGWLYVTKERNISLLENNSIAFFDELLTNKKYGLCRGAGVLISTQHGWKISQYNLSLMVPNGVASDVVKQIKSYEQ